MKEESVCFLAILAGFLATLPTVIAHGMSSTSWKYFVSHAAKNGKAGQFLTCSSQVSEE